MAASADMCLSTCPTMTLLLQAKPSTRGRIAGQATGEARTINASSPSSYTCRALHHSTRCPDTGPDILLSLRSSLSLSSSSMSASSVAMASSRSNDSYSLPPPSTPSPSLIPAAGRCRVSLCLRQRRTSSGGGLAGVGRRRRLLCSTSSPSTWLSSSFPSLSPSKSSSTSSSSSPSSRARRGRTRSGSGKGGAMTSTCRSGNGGGGGISTTSCSSSAIDVVATLKTERILILGGSGFVGSAISKSALKQGIEVVSLSRSGRSPYGGESGGGAVGGADGSSSSSGSASSGTSAESSWADQVTWVKGDVFTADWSTLLEGVTTVVSCIGGFGNNEQMEKINGEANVQAVAAARQAEVGRFIYVSVHDYNLPSFVRSVGYFSGKQRAEKAVLENFPSTGVILRPGFIYGKRKVNGVDVALDQVGQPLEKLLEGIDSWIKPLKALPASDLLLLPPVSVEDVADAAVKAVIDDSIAGILDVQAIKETAASLFTPA